MLARRKHRLYKRIGRFYPAHGFHHNPNLRIVGDHPVVMYDFILNWIPGKIADIQDIFYLNAFPGPFCNEFTVDIQHLHNARADRAVSHYCCFYHISSIPGIYSLASIFR